jgi:hypothetical protein
MRVVRYPLAHIPWDDVAPLIGSSFFGSPGFANLWRTLGGQPVYWLVEQGNRVMAVLPGVEFGIKPFKRFYAMPAGCYAKLFHNPDITTDREQIARMVLDALAAQRYVKLFLYDFYEPLPADSRFNIQTCTTTLVDVSDPDWQPPDRNLRQEIRKAVREGLHVEKFDSDRHFSQFLHLVKLSEKRIGRRCPFSTEFFKALAALAEEDKRVHWAWSEHNGQAVSSQIFLVEHDNLLFWQTYFEKALTFLKPNQYVPFATAKRLAREGVRWLNFGTSPENAPGITFYKKRWGGKLYSYNCYVMKRGLGRFL